MNEHEPNRSEPARARKFQFGLKQLLLVITAFCLLLGVFSWSLGIGLLASPPIISLTVTVLTRKISYGVVAFIVCLPCICLLMPARSVAPLSAKRAKCLYNLKHISLALLEYHDDHGSFPPAYIVDEYGQPMHSWRVLILPYLDEQKLYDQYAFNEPWDGPNNSKLAAQTPAVFRCPSDERGAKDVSTNYVAVIGKHTAWPGEKGRSLRLIFDGPETTILVVEVANSGIGWMEPRDLHMLQMNMRINGPAGQGISSYHPRGASAAFADGSTHFLWTDMAPETLRALLSVDGGEEIEGY